METTLGAESEEETTQGAESEVETTAGAEAEEETTEMAALIAYGDAGTGTCVPPYWSIANEQDCRDAADALGARFIRSGYFNIASGCVANVDVENEGAKIWFNTNNNGRAVDHRRPVCELPEPQTTPGAESEEE